MNLSDELVRRLARQAGVSPTFTDWDGSEKTASIDTLRGILDALGYACRSDAQTRNALAAFEAGAGVAQARFVTARVGLPVLLPRGGAAGERVEIAYEDGETRAVAPLQGGLALPPFDRPGYHKARLRAGEFTIAVAPERCFTFRDLSGGRPGWGLAAQIYSLGAGVECGVGDFGGVAELARASAAKGADLLAISPFHALLGVPERFDSPYTPSSREFFDPVYADPRLALSPELARKAQDRAALKASETRRSVDWPAARAAKAALLRAAYEGMRDTPLRAEFERFVAQAPAPLKTFALFEAIRADRAPVWDWREWPAEFRSPEAQGAKAFARDRGEAVEYQIFLQWLTDRSCAAAQDIAKRAGMQVGLIADIATGLDPAGADAWARRDVLLRGLTLGAPPDPYTPPGQDWRLTTFSPQGLAASGYAPFIDMIRACLAQVGGVRLDHAMGMQRLWLIPQGAGPAEGTYVSYPSETLFRLIALESWRRRAIVIGEDLGTFPAGFREYLAEQGASGMRLLRIQRVYGGAWKPPGEWPASAAALTATHDIMSTAGWWKGADLDGGEKQDERARDRGLLWRAFCEAEVAEGEPPPPEGAQKAVDAAFGFIAATPCQIKLLTLEDALAEEIQPNTPGTTVEKPNWRHRFIQAAETMLSRPDVAARLRKLESV